MCVYVCVMHVPVGVCVCTASCMWNMMTSPITIAADGLPLLYRYAHTHTHTHTHNVRHGPILSSAQHVSQDASELLCKRSELSLCVCVHVCVCVCLC